MKKLFFTVAVICTFCCCNNSNPSGNYIAAGNADSTNADNDSIVNNDTVYDLYGSNNDTPVSTTNATQEKVEYANTDYTETYFIFNNPDKFYSGEQYDIDDLKESGSLLFTQNGIVKAIEFVNGWQKVSHFTKKVFIPNEWWKYNIYYETKLFGQSEITIYLPMVR